MTYSIILTFSLFFFICAKIPNSCRLLSDPTAFFSDRLLRQSRLHDADLGYVLIVDRRSDRWNAVKATLLRLSVRAAATRVCRTRLYSFIHSSLFPT